MKTMYHYRFECRTNLKTSENIRFIVEGAEKSRTDCVKIHNALIASKQIIISGASITTGKDEQYAEAGQ